MRVPDNTTIFKGGPCKDIVNHLFCLFREVLQISANDVQGVAGHTVYCVNVSTPTEIVTDGNTEAFAVMHSSSRITPQRS